MAYSMYEQSLMKSEKHVQYYPEEYEYANRNYNHSPAEQSPRTLKKNRKIHPPSYGNEQKCPIYIHQFNRSPESNIHANYLSINETKKPKSKSQNSKLVLDKLEETYWATWKPSKDSRTKTTAGYEKRKTENIAEKLVKYFEKSDFPSTSASATEETIQPSKTYKQYETTTQQIQTDSLYPVSFSNYEEEIEATQSQSSRTIPEETSSLGSVSQCGRNSEETSVVEVPTAAGKEPENATTEEEIAGEEAPAEAENALTHTDSFIITKRKLNAVREYLQQPRCIKLYRKTGSSYLKGGSYPLKPCLKKETAPGGSFRLGAPGRPLFVTGSSSSKRIM